MYFALLLKLLIKPFIQLELSVPLYSAFNKLTGLVIALLLLAISGLTKLSSNASYLAYFDKDSPLVNAHLTKRADFSTHDQLVLILHSQDQAPLSNTANFYKHSKRLIKDIEQLSSVKNVTSFLKEYRWRNNVFSQKRQAVLLSEDGSSAIILIDVALEDNKDAKQILNFNHQVSQLVDTQFDHSNIRYYLSGELGLNNAYIQTLRHDLKRFLPLLLITMLVVLGLILANFKRSLGIFSIGLLSTFGALGVVGWLGYSLTSINAFTPIIIIGLSIVTNMHNCIAFYQRLAKGQDKRKALSNSFFENLTPVTMSCFTTAAGFLFLISSPSPPVVVTGIASALGILFSWLLSITLYQTLLFKLAPVKFNKNSLAQRLWQWPSLTFIKRYSRVIIMLAVIGAALGVAGISQLTINDNVYRYFPKDYSFRQSIDLLKSKFNGVINVDYVIRAKSKSSEQNTLPITHWSQAHWQQLSDFSDRLVQSKDVTAIYPSQQQLTQEQIKTFYNKQNTSKSGLHTYIDKQGHQLRIQIKLNELSSHQLLAFDAAITHWVKEQSFTELQISQGTSADILFANLSDNNARSMLISLLIALTTISIVSGVLLASIKLCALVFICNFLPILIAYGLLGLTGGYLTLGSTVVIGMIIGIIVDDTLHLLFKFKRYKQQSNLNQALAKLQQRVFSPVILSSIVIILALAVGLVSDFKPTFEISLFSIVVITLALLTDILLLPCLLAKQLFVTQINTTHEHRE